MHGKRSADEPPDADTDTFGDPEGRFLLLPVSFQSADDAPHLFPTSILQPPDSAASAADAQEERSARAARARLARRRLASRGDTDYYRHNRVKRRVQWPRPVEMAGDGDSLRASVRRSYNDIADVCVEHHCGQMSPHTISYFQCVDRYCTGKRV